MKTFRHSTSIFVCLSALCAFVAGPSWAKGGGGGSQAGSSATASAGADGSAADAVDNQDPSSDASGGAGHGGKGRRARKRRRAEERREFRHEVRQDRAACAAQLGLTLPSANGGTPLSDADRQKLAACVKGGLKAHKTAMQSCLETHGLVFDANGHATSRPTRKVAELCERQVKAGVSGGATATVTSSGTTTETSTAATETFTSTQTATSTETVTSTQTNTDTAGAVRSGADAKSAL